MNFTNKNVIITGGTLGIGYSTAAAFLAAGAKVWITGRTAEKLADAEKKLNHTHLKTIVSDTSSMEGIQQLEKYVLEQGIKVDVLFLNAGIAAFAPIEFATEEQFDAQFNTNVKGAYFTLQKLIPFLNEGSSVIFTSSTNATAQALNSSVYSATKGALNKIAQIASNELADRKIRVNLISPGPTETPGLINAIPSEAKEYLESATALKRLGKPSEIANTVLFLASEQASFITGTEMIVDGGLLSNMLK